MNIKKIVQIGALVVVLAAGSAGAQTAGSVNVTSSSATTTISAGKAVTLGTVTLAGMQGGGDVTSLPITISGSNGGVANNLSNCQVFNSAGTSLTSNSAVNTVAGANTFMFNAPLSVNSTTGTTTLSVRCDVASSTASGAMFAINGGSASLGPVLRVNLDTAPSVPAGSNDVALANISVGATGASYNVIAIPLMVSASSNGSVANLTDCKIRDTSDLDGSLTNVTSITNGTATSFNLTSPLLINAGSAKMLSLTCDVQPATAVGSTFTTSINPASVTASNASTGAVVTPVGVALGNFGPNGLPASTSGTTIVSAIGTAPVAPGTLPGTTPGVPNTGFGGNNALLAEIMLAGLIALIGAFYLGRTQA